MQKKFSVVDTLSLILTIGLGVYLVLLQQRVTRLELIANGNDALEGARLLPMPAVNLSGAQTIVPAGHQRVIFYMSPRCGSCGKNMPAWSEAARRLGRDNVLFLVADAGSMTEIDGYLAQYKVAGFPAVRADQGVLQKFSMMQLPRTLVIDRAGKVQKVWRGAVSSPSIVDSWLALNR